MPNLYDMMAKAELLELVGALSDSEAASVLDTLNAARFRAIQGKPQRVELDEQRAADDAITHTGFKRGHKQAVDQNAADDQTAQHQRCQADMAAKRATDDRAARQRYHDGAGRRRNNPSQ